MLGLGQLVPFRLSFALIWSTSRMMRSLFEAQIISANVDCGQRCSLTTDDLLIDLLSSCPQNSVVLISIKASFKEGSPIHGGKRSAVPRAHAATSQMLIAAAIHENLKKLGRTGAQILLSVDDIECAHRLNNLRLTLASLLECKVIPVVGWNYAVQLGSSFDGKVDLKLIVKDALRRIFSSTHVN